MIKDIKTTLFLIVKVESSLLHELQLYTFLRFHQNAQVSKHNAKIIHTKLCISLSFGNLIFIQNASL